MDNKSLNKIDLSVFKISEIKCNVVKVLKCSCLQRVGTALKYYDVLCGQDDNDTNQSIVGKQIFSTFCNESYPHFLDDYIHCITKHGDNLITVAEELRNAYLFGTECITNRCGKLRRHYDSRRRGNKNEDEAKEDFYCGYFDQLHHFIFHLYDIGMRAEINEEIEEKMNTNDDLSCFDRIFEQKRDLIRSKRETYGNNIDRYNQENNKYNMKIETIENNKDGEDDNDETVLDSIYAIIFKDNKDIIISFNQFCNENEYDTEAIGDDLSEFTETNDAQSNIANLIRNKLCVDEIKHHVKNIKSLQTSFATGFRFIYWQKQIKKQSSYEMYVKPFYDDIKEEILCSGFVNINQWNNEMLGKANEYFKSNKIKQMKGRGRKYETKGALISKSHVISIILYCDFTDLCTDFSATFRKNNIFETVASIKRRNSKYANFSRLLIETVVDFGAIGRNGTTEKGPFYCGLSCILNMSSFAITLIAPCSTSKQMTVAMNFAKRNGLIIQLQNDGDGKWASFFDCSWISTYGEEDERLFIYGNVTLRMESIRIIEAAKNYKIFFHCFHLFDSMLSGVNIDNKNICVVKADIKILDKLISNKLYGTSHKFDKYICDCFDLFCYKKEQIVITIRWLHDYFSDLNHWIIHSTFNYGYKKPNLDHREKWVKVNDELTDVKNTDHDTKSNVNMLKPDIFKMFPNVNKMIINTTFGNVISWREYPIYSFSLSSFLSFIECCNTNIKYIIKAYPKSIPDRQGETIYTGSTWMENTISTTTKQSFNDRKWNIQKTKQNQKDTLTVTKC